MRKSWYAENRYQSSVWVETSNKCWQSADAVVFWALFFFFLSDKVVVVMKKILSAIRITPIPVGVSRLSHYQYHERTLFSERTLVSSKDVNGREIQLERWWSFKCVPWKGSSSQICPMTYYLHSETILRSVDCTHVPTTCNLYTLCAY